MQFEGAVIREQGVTFAVVVVKRHVVENPAVANFDDELILEKVRVAVEAAETLKRTTVEVDTLIDIDRGYNPRHGLLDRRCNLRPAGTWLARRQALG